MSMDRCECCEKLVDTDQFILYRKHLWFQRRSVTPTETEYTLDGKAIHYQGLTNVLYDFMAFEGAMTRLCDPCYERYIPEWLHDKLEQLEERDINEFLGRKPK